MGSLFCLITPSGTELCAQQTEDFCSLSGHYRKPLHAVARLQDFKVLKTTCAASQMLPSDILLCA